MSFHRVSTQDQGQDFFFFAPRNNKPLLILCTPNVYISVLLARDVASSGSLFRRVGESLDASDSPHPSPSNNCGGGSSWKETRRSSTTQGHIPGGSGAPSWPRRGAVRRLERRAAGWPTVLDRGTPCLDASRRSSEHAVAVGTFVRCGPTFSGALVPSVGARSSCTHAGLSTASSRNNSGRPD